MLTIKNMFNNFLKNVVNIKTENSKKAKKSRDNLLTVISKFPDNNSLFPNLHADFNVYFGSFARKTKTRPLDDIDLMVGIAGDGCSYSEKSWDNINISFKAGYVGKLKSYADTNNSLYLNSTKITNIFKKELNNVQEYLSAEIKRNGEAVTLKLKSYDWNFDIVPCFRTAPDVKGNRYYLIPNGNGNWKKTNPKLDQDRLSAANQKQSGRILDIIRILKYWNNEKKINIGSYLLEAIILYYYEDKEDDYCSECVDIELINIFEYLAYNIINVVPDPKNIQENINDIDDKYSLSAKIFKYLEVAKNAKKFEENGEFDKSINEWRKIFGEKF